MLPFEEMKRINDHGAECWIARDLQPRLGSEGVDLLDSVGKRGVALRHLMQIR
jgi:hypothetical protein